MSPRRLSIVVLVGLALGSGCGGTPKSDEPTTAKEKQEREAKAKGETDGGPKNWGKWRYQGSRDACFFIVGARCFKTENKACQAARCKKPTKCATEGAAPATVSCKK